MGSTPSIQVNQGIPYAKMVATLAREGYRRHNKSEGLPTEAEINKLIQNRRLLRWGTYPSDGQVIKKYTGWFSYPPETIFKYKTFRITAEEFMNSKWIRDSFLRKLTRYTGGIHTPGWEIEIYTRTADSEMVFLATIQD